MIKCIILDLDGTLIDTSALEGLRARREWRSIPNHYNECDVNQEVADILSAAQSSSIKVCIHTNSPSNYARGLLEHFGLSIDYLVAFHDVQNRKPAPDGIEKILGQFNLKPQEVVYLGDNVDDQAAAQNANVEFFAVSWGNVSDIEDKRLGVSKLIEYVWKSIDEQGPRGHRSNIIQAGNHFFLGYYASGTKPDVLDFKENKQDTVDRWINKTLELSSFLPQVNCVVRALGHAETQVHLSDLNAPLDKLGEQLAHSLGAIYRPDIVRKNRVLVKSVRCSKKERERQVQGAYSIIEQDSLFADTERASFLVIDDVLTSGATTREVIRAISSSYPEATVYVFTLVKTLYRSQDQRDSLESQHNTRLIADLYTPLEHFDEPYEGVSEAHPVHTRGLISKSFSANYANTNHNFIFQNLSSFSIASEQNSKTVLDAIFVLKNMLQRGKPTLASHQLRKSVGLEEFRDQFDQNPQALISRKSVKWQRLIKGNLKTGSNPAKHFFDNLIPRYLGEYEFIKQLVLPEVQIFDMTQVYVEQFHNRQVDFYIPHIGLIIEIDGSQHKNSSREDTDRDQFAATLGIKTIRFTTEEIASENSAFIEKAENMVAHIRMIDKLEQNGVLIPPNGITIEDYRSAYNDRIDIGNPYLRLTAAIRFQLLILELIERGTIRFGEEKKLYLLNRDGIDFANHALLDIKQYLNNLFVLLGEPLLELKLKVSEVSDFSGCNLGEDLLIDFSILERFDDAFQTNPHVITARTHYLDFYRHFSQRDANSIENATLVDYDFFEMSCAEPINYELDLSPESEQREALRFFLSNLFLPNLEEVDFREGQIGIIGSALSRKSTIGLLPTGSGKSICYQLSAILQPAISFVVCPIKSLMYDQKADLDAVGFTRSNFITSELKPDEKLQIQNEFGRGKYFFVFISPERFQTHAFRSEMVAIGLDHAFSYAVIDEVHCLSEWGHDFRTSYLNLANTVERLAPDSSYIGLTATASLNVLKDIQSEFSIPDDNIRTPLEFTREELSFHVLDDKGKKSDTLLRLVESLDGKWNGDAEALNEFKAGIIFTPTVNGADGCYELAGRLSSKLDLDVRYFSGSPPKQGSLRGEAFDRFKRDVQNDFKSNNYRLLTATKAFGMGVNKGNIAYTIHYGIPGSMEALYQEAGRAGRDKDLFKSSPADCYTLLTKEKNIGALDTIWDASTSVTDLKNAAGTLSRESDLNTNLWFMTTNLDSIGDEFKILNNIYNFLSQNTENETVVASASQFNVDKSKFEKGVYRLSQLGIVSDWMVEDFFNGKLNIEFCYIPDETIEENLVRTVRKYEPGFSLEDIYSSNSEYYQILCDRLHKGKVTRTQFLFLVLLVWSYDHFVYNRRQSLKTVYEQCSALASGTIDGTEFKDRLEGYFKFNESSHLMHHLAENAADSSIWLSIFYDQSDDADEQMLIGIEEVSVLREQLARFLESYKDNVCLNYISGVIRLIFDQFDDADGERRMASSIDRLMQQEHSDLETLVEETLKLKPLFSIDAQCRFARLIYDKLPTPHILQMLNSGFGDPYTYRKILEPLAERLENLNQTYKEVRW